MARKRKGLTGGEMADVNIGRELTAKMGEAYKATSELSAKAQKQLMSGRKVSKELQKDMRKQQKALLKLITQNAKLLASREKLAKAADKEGESVNDLEARLRREIATSRKSIDATDRAVDVQKEHAGVLGKVGNALSSVGDMLANNISRYISLTAVVTGLKKIYDTFVGIQQSAQKGMGEFAMQVGGTSEQLQRHKQIAMGMSDTFGQLTEDAIGVDKAFEFMGELAPHIRESRLQTQEFSNNILALSRGMGLGAEKSVELFRLLGDRGESSKKVVADFASDMQNFAADIGAFPSQLAQDFAGAQNNVAAFGDESVQVFQNAALMANRFGFEANKILESMKKFDNFQTAADNVNTLNAMFGTTLNSFELMIEKDPTKKLEMIRQGVLKTGQGWSEMNRFQRRQLSETFGMEEKYVKRLFTDNISLAELEEERAKKEKKRQKQEEKRQEVINKLISATDVAFETIGRTLTRITATLSKAFSPLIKSVRDYVMDIAANFEGWVKELTESENFQKSIKDLAKDIKTFIGDTVDYLKNMDWKEVKKDLSKWWEAAKGIGAALKPVFGFLRDHPEALVAFLALSTVNKVTGGLGQMAGLIGRGGPIVLGAAAFAVQMQRSGEAAEKALKDVKKINKVEKEYRTKEEKEKRKKVKRSARTAVRGRALEGKSALGKSEGISGFFGEVGAGMMQTATDLGIADFSEELQYARAGLGESIRTSIAAGATPREMRDQLQNLAKNNPEAESRIRRALGIKPDDPFLPSVQNKLLKIYKEEAAASGASEKAEKASARLPVGPETSSATQTAPSTQATANAPTKAGSQREIVIRGGDVIMDGRKVGKVPNLRQALNEANVDSSISGRR